MGLHHVFSLRVASAWEEPKLYQCVEDCGVSTGTIFYFFRTSCGIPYSPTKTF